MADKDFYATLGVPRNASDEDIKKAFRKLAMKHHPDRNAGDKTSEETFKSIKEAYDVLSDPEKRSVYDRFGADALQGGGGGGGPSMGGVDLNDIFEQFFGGGRGQSGPQRGRDIQYNYEISLEEAASGVDIALAVNSAEPCETCKGSGAKSGTSATPCKTCDGHGQVRVQQGFFSVQHTCPHCQGKGKVNRNPCSTCHGDGHVKKKKNLQISIPAGIDNGMRVRSVGNGEAGGQGSKNGDLYVEVRVRPHAVFERDGNDLHCQVPVSFTLAALGGEVVVPLLGGGKGSIAVPGGTQNGATLRIRGKGMKAVRGNSHGDLFCHVLVETPVNLTESQKKLLRDLDASLSQGGHQPKTNSWRERAKQIFGG